MGGEGEWKGASTKGLAETKEETFSIQVLEHVKFLYSEGNTEREEISVNAMALY